MVSEQFNFLAAQAALYLPWVTAVHTRQTEPYKTGGGYGG